MVLKERCIGSSQCVPTDVLGDANAPCSRFDYMLHDAGHPVGVLTPLNWACEDIIAVFRKSGLIAVSSTKVVGELCEQVLTAQQWAIDLSIVAEGALQVEGFSYLQRTFGLRSARSITRSRTSELGINLASEWHSQMTMP